MRYLRLFSQWRNEPSREHDSELADLLEPELYAWTQWLRAKCAPGEERLHLALNDERPSQALSWTITEWSRHSGSF